MKNQQNNFLFSSNFFKNESMEEEYTQWIQPSRRVQIRAISILTAVLYIIYSQIDKVVLPSDTILLATVVHLYIIPPILFLISILSFFEKFYNKLIYLLIMAPIGATIGNLILISNLENFTMYLTEIYLIIFWVFTVSGLRLLSAIFSVCIIFVLVIISTFYLFHLPLDLSLMHFFWMLCVTSFGYLGAYLLERSSKMIFLNNKKLENLVVTDTLTGLYNRLKLDEVLEKELDRSQRFNHTFGLVIIDIDCFKDVNDTYGHQIGDKVLVEISNILKQNTRSTDILVRWGGEEFVILCLETNKEGVLNLVENIRAKVENHIFDMIGTKTISAGVTIYKKCDSVQALIKRADTALYHAKNSGRNCIEIL